MTSTEGTIVLVGRILFAVFFIRSAIAHVRKHRGMGDYARSARLPAPAIAGWPTGIWLLAASLSIALGIWPDIGSLMIAVFVVLAALYFHRFWRLEDADQRQTQAGSFYRNVALLGASLAMMGFFVAAGEGLRFAVTGPLLDP
ncbi:MAG: DoxX family protein [Actinomycetota bacterium]